MGLFNFGNTPDWVSKNESDGETFYGYNDGEGRTNWYDKRGTLVQATVHRLMMIVTIICEGINTTNS